MPYQKEILELLKQLHTSQQNWLSSQQVQKLQQQYGRNILTNENKLTPWKVFFSQFKSFLILILILAAGVSYLAGEKVEAMVIFGVIILNTLLWFFQEYNAEKSIENLRKMASLKVRVIRDQKEDLIDSEELVIGDIIILEAGDKIAADARILEVYSLETAESVLTGESLPVEKSKDVIQEIVQIGDQTNMLFSGTVVTKGRWVAVVTATGMQTEIGKIAGMIQEAPDKQTKLQQDLNVLSKWLGLVILWICVIVFIVHVFFLGEDPQEAFLVAIALSVAAIPEWLPTVVTICLGIGVKILVKKQALVKKLWSVETLGSVDVICSDKTGTLTKNEMTVKKIFVDNQLIDVQGIGYEDDGEEPITQESPSLEMLLRIGLLCNSAELEEEEIIGDPTELALLISANKGGLDEDQEEYSYQLIEELPFDSERKLMSMLRKKGKTYTLFTKGAPEMLLDRCDRILINGKLKNLTQKERQNILEMNTNFAQHALRVLWFAYKESWTPEVEEEGLIFVGLQGIIDPPRPEARKAIATCHKAGIRVIMITGDNVITASAIAKELGIQGISLDGQSLEEMSDEELLNQIEHIWVFARVTPSHKQRIITLLKQKGHTVAMTGDGVNDAPALKFADIGLAMRITGTEVTKEASDMILMDDNFSTIVHAIEEGRGIYNNIKKFVNFLFATNFAEIMIVFISILLGLPLPLIAIQILWINLISDGLPALALGIDSYDPHLMSQKPRKLWSKIINATMIKNILLLAAIVTIGCLRFFLRHYEADLIAARTGTFLLLILLEFVVIQMIRRDYGVKFWSNAWLFIAIVASILLTLALIYVPFLAEIFKVVPLSGVMWLEILGVVVGIGLLSLIVHKIKGK